MTIVLLVSSVAPARAATGSVAGVVRDTTGTPIAGAQITLQGSTKRYTATADVHGAFAMSAVDEGTYGLAVRAPGFAPIGNRQITVTAGAVGQIEIALTRATTNGVATLGSVTVNGSSALSRSSAPTVELNPQALASQGAWQLTDVLGQQLEATMVHEQGGAPGLPQTLALRGGDPQETLVDIDGHQLNNENTGDFDLELLDPGEFAGVQIVYGVGPSSLVGADYEGGAVNFRTIEPTARSQGLLRFSYGSFNTFGETIEATGTDARIGYALLYRRFTTQGEVNDYPIVTALPAPGVPAQTAIVGSNIDATTALAKIRYSFAGSAGFVEATFRDTAAYRNLSAPLSSPDNANDFGPNAPFTQVNFPGAAVLTTAPAYGLDLQLPLGRKGSEGEWPSTLSFSHLTNLSDQSVENIPPDLNPYLLNANDIVNDDIARFDRPLPGSHGGELSFAVDVRRETLDAPDALAPGPPQQSAAQGWVVGRYTWSSNSDLNYTLATYYSWDSTFGTSLDPRIGIVWSPGNSVVHASFGTGFQPPLLTNLVFNPSLLAERSVAYDLGAEHRFGEGSHAPSASFDIYNTVVNNPTYETEGAGGALTFLGNISQNVYRGIDLRANQSIARGLSAQAAYGVDSVYTTSDPSLTNPQAPPLIPGQQAMGVPLHKAQLGLLGHPGAGSLNFGVSATYESDANELNRPAYVLLDANVGTTFGHTDINVAGTNLTNQFNDKFTLVNAGVPFPIPGGTMPTNAYSLQGAALRVTVTQRF